MRMTMGRYSLAALFCAGLVFAGLPASAQTQTVQRTTTYPTRSPSGHRTAVTSAQTSHQYERIYLSTRGELLGAHTIFGSTILYIDRAGDLDLTARDYTAELDYDYRGRLNRIGSVNIAYDYRGRIEQVGSSVINYDFRSRLNQIGRDGIAYTSRGNVSQIGNVSIQYDSGHIETISANYTSAGTRIIIVGY